MSQTRTPSARYSALPMAAAGEPNLHSPMPSFGWSGLGMITVSIAGTLGEARDRVPVPVQRGDPIAIQRHRLLQGHAGSVDDPALELVASTVGVDDQPGIVAHQTRPAGTGIQHTPFRAGMFRWRMIVS